MTSKNKGNTNLHKGPKQKDRKWDIYPKVSGTMYLHDKTYWKNLIDSYGIDLVLKVEGLTLKELKVLAGETLTEFMHKPKSKKDVENTDDRRDI